MATKASSLLRVAQGLGLDPMKSPERVDLNPICAKCGILAYDVQIVRRRSKYGVYEYVQWRHEVTDRRKTQRYIYHYQRQVS